MADRTQQRIADRDDNIAEDDPFAELTRIMGFDPRVPVKPESESRSEVVAEDDFAIDLEKELMGEFGDEPPPEPEAVYAPEATPAHTSAHEAGYPQPHDAHFDAEPDFDQAAASSLADDLFLDEPAFDEASAEAHAAPVDFIADDRSDFADFDDMLASELTETRADANAGLVRPDEPLAAEFSEPALAEDDFLAFDDADFAFDEPQAEVPAQQPIATGFDDAGFGDNGDEFERALAAAVFDDAAERTSEQFAPEGPVAENYAQQFVESVQPEAVAEAPQVSLEDELSALLNRMSARPEPAYEPGFELEKPLDVHVEHVSDPAHEDFDLDLDLAAFDAQPQPAPQPFVPETQADPVEALQPFVPAAAVAAASAHAQSWSRGTPFIRQQPAQDQQAEPAAYQPQQPEPAFAAVAPDYVVSSPSHAAVSPEFGHAAPVAQPAPRQPATEMPELETIEIPEKAVALADDLDIPDVPFEEDKAEAPAYDDLDAEFTSLMGEMNVNEVSPDESASSFEAPGQQTATHAAAPVSAGVSNQPADDTPEAFGGFDFNEFSRQPYAAQQGVEDGFDYDPDAGEAMSEADDMDEQRPRSRMFLVAAVVGAVALVGGIGAFALSFGGGDSGDAPVLVKADESPIKVKPENPGGAVIPNQDNKVYDMVAKGGKPVAPTQETLVSDAEQPVDVAARAPDARIVGEGAPAKSEDRIEPAQVDDESAVDETPAVAPRKVRTMVVRPDGTLVAREDPQPAQQIAATEPTDPAPQTVSVPGAEQTGAVTPAVNPQQTASTPSAAPVAPQRPAEQPVDIVGEVKPGQVAALDPNAAAAGAWAMQIASQPSVEAAQSTYQDLARRYAGVLQGRSVNIVKAEVAGKGTFYRVRVAADSRAEAISLCEKYKAAGGACFVSK
ncbi:SPOR domain-containing protein [Aquamicrobium ahrensii]|uniref:SPOR domain-containing protein n=1 Tax=Aquamicrobium ahrensii TaxID=469551 RepID=A0ABV2KF78_9HYPH